MFNVPHVTSIYLIKHSAFDAIKYDHKDFDPDMAMCDSLRNAVSESIYLSMMIKIILSSF